MDEVKKNVDESWKETAAKEKKKLEEEGEFVPPEPDFNFFITTLALQASISLGAIPNPSTNQKEENATQAKFIIDTLGMLKEKTKGNLTKEEEDLLERVLYELRMQYVAKGNKQENTEVT